MSFRSRVFRLVVQSARQYVQQVIENSSPIHPTPGFLGSRTWQSHQNKKRTASQSSANPLLSLLFLLVCCRRSRTHAGKRSPLSRPLDISFIPSSSSRQSATRPDRTPSPPPKWRRYKYAGTEWSSALPGAHAHAAQEAKRRRNKTPLLSQPFKPGLLLPWVETIRRSRAVSCSGSSGPPSSASPWSPRPRAPSPPAPAASPSPARAPCRPVSRP